MHYEVVHAGGEKHQAADVSSRLHTGSKETTYLDEDLSVCNVENTQVPNEETPYMHICTECDVAKEPIEGKPDKERTKNGAFRIITEQPTEHLTKIDEVPTIEDFNVEKTKYAFCFYSTT